MIIRRVYRLLLIPAVLTGIGIAWVDSRPTWDDTGITAGALLLTGAVFGAAVPDRPWLSALAVGAWVPALGIALHGNYGSLIAPVFALVGSYVGAVLRRSMIGHYDGVHSKPL